jgi:hypothetical protein
MRDILDDLLTSRVPFHSDLSPAVARAALARLLAAELSAARQSAAAVALLRRVHC